MTEPKILHSLCRTKKDDIVSYVIILLYTAYMQDFDTWNNLKKKIEEDEIDPNKFPKEGEVWMSNLGRNIGYEQNGSGDSFSRPVLIVKKFNNHMFWVVPLSTKQKKFDFYFNYTDPYNEKVSAILAQLKLLSVKRLKRNMYSLENNALKEIKGKLKNLMD